MFFHRALNAAIPSCVVRSTTSAGGIDGAATGIGVAAAGGAACAARTDDMSSSRNNVRIALFPAGHGSHDLLLIGKLQPDRQAGLRADVRGGVSLARQIIDVFDGSGGANAFCFPGLQAAATPPSLCV